MAKQEPTAEQSKPWTKLIVLALVAAVVAAVYFQFGDRLSLDSLADQESALRRFQSDHPVLVYLIAFLVYVAITGLSLPGAAALTLVYGWYFGLLRGVVLVSFASTAGATVAFLLSRYLFREPIQRRFGEQLARFNEALDREGAFYLFTLRLIPAVPFFVINVVMGLTGIRTATFWWVSQLGMFAGTIVYVYAGSTIPTLQHLADPSQLRTGDVLDWEQLGAIFEAPSEANSPQQRLRELLPKEARAELTGASATPSPEAQAALLAGLNDVLIRPDFALNAHWQPTFHPQKVPAEQQRATEKRLTRMNRDLLVAAFPEVISPPRPILSKQLLAAFVILGVFPLVVKKLMQRFKPAPSINAQS